MMEVHVIPGEIFYHDAPITANADRPKVTLQVTNRGDRPIQVGSHFHFFEVNPALDFDREQAYGMRLDIPAGTAVRFEPGMSKTVTLVASNHRSLHVRRSRSARWFAGNS